MPIIPTMDKTSQAVALASTAALAALLVCWKCPSSSNKSSGASYSLPKRWYSSSPGASEAMQFRIKAVNRIELGQTGGLPALELEDKGDNSINLATLLRRKNTVLYLFGPFYPVLSLLR